MTTPVNQSLLSERALAQRERILEAARRCFVEHGFHAASMATIAETAQMSPGLIYRYFDSKNAIIVAIIEQQLKASRDSISSLHQSSDMGDTMIRTFEFWRNGEPSMMNASLFLEISAEARRDAKIAQALHSFDLEMRKELANWLCADPAAGGKGIPKEVGTARALSLQIFFEGLAARAVREPDLDQEVLKTAIAEFLEGLFARDK